MNRSKLPFFIQAEHLASIVSSLVYMFNCEPNETYFDDFFKGHLSHLFAVLPYNILLVVFGKFINIISTFAWNFMDLFVILNSIGMAYTFKQLSDFICQEYRNVSDRFNSELASVSNSFVPAHLEQILG